MLAYQVFSGILMRIALLGVSLIWLVYMSFLGNTPGVINEIITSAVLIFTIYKMSTGEISKINYKQKIILTLKRIKPRISIDLERYMVLRDVKKYFNKNVDVHYEKKELN